MSDYKKEGCPACGTECYVVITDVQGTAYLDPVVSADEITSLKEQLAEREWVSVEDRLPEKGDLVITVSDHGDTSSLYSEYFEGTKFWSKAFNNITHWMPLPSPPTGEENG